MQSDWAGYFQQRLRIYDLQKMDSEPGTVRDVPDKVRCAAWHNNDNLILTSYTDQPGIGCALFPSSASSIPYTNSRIFLHVPGVQTTHSACHHGSCAEPLHALCSVWDTRTSTLVKTLPTGKEVTSIEISQDGRYITTADGTEVHSASFCFTLS